MRVVSTISSDSQQEVHFPKCEITLKLRHDCVYLSRKAGFSLPTSFQVQTRESNVPAKWREKGRKPDQEEVLYNMTYFRIHAARENRRTSHAKISFDSSVKFAAGTVLCRSHMTVIWLLSLMTDGSPEMESRRWQVTPSTAQRCTDCESQRGDTITNRRFTKR